MTTLKTALEIVPIIKNAINKADLNHLCVGCFFYCTKNNIKRQQTELYAIPRGMLSGPISQHTFAHNSVILGVISKIPKLFERPLKNE